MVDIAREVKRDPKTVYYWMKKHRIQTRPRGSYEKNYFKKGHKMRLGIKHTDETKKKISEKSKGKKPYLRNGEHWLHDEGSVNPNWKGGITSERISLYNSQEWADVIKQVWARDDKTCQICGKKQDKRENGGEYHIHHIMSFSVKEKRTELDNLVLLCKRCHRWVHSKKNKNGILIKN